MTALRQNPFNKPNPYRPFRAQKFEHAHLPSSSALGTSRFLNSSNSQHSSVTNNWVFNENNLSKRVDVTKKYEMNNSQVSDFEVRMKMSSVYALPNEKVKQHERREEKIQNPFLRKNLIVNREESKNLAEIDISLYRHKAKSHFEENLQPIYEQRERRPSMYEEQRKSIPNESTNLNQIYGGIKRMSFGNVPKENPYLSKRESSNSNVPALVISHYMQEEEEVKPALKTPVESYKNPEENAPLSIEFQRKRFFLTPVVDQ